jgi:uncharacterized protein (DUF1697 family)
MSEWIALLRGVNLGNRRLSMTDLRAFAEEVGFERPRTLLQSGNLVFASPSAAKAAGLERRLEAAAADRLGFPVEFHLRTPVEWRAMIAANPFPDAARDGPGRFVLLALKDAPGKAAVAALKAAHRGPEMFEARGRHVYVVYPEGQARSRLTPALLDRHLGRGTGRNWNTVLKLAAMVEGGG